MGKQQKSGEIKRIIQKDSFTSRVHLEYTEA